MEINVDKTKIMTNNPVGVITSIKVNNQSIYRESTEMHIPRCHNKRRRFVT